MKNKKKPQIGSFYHLKTVLVTPSREMSNFLMEDLERVLQLETLDYRG